MEKVKISLFIPVYNEERIIEENVSKVVNEIKKLPYNFELFMVDDSSADNSGKILDELDKKIPNLTHLRYENGPTRRENLAQSFKKAKNDIIVFMDMDLATNLKYLTNLIGSIGEYDIVTGSRYVKGSKTKRKLSRLIVSHIYNSFVRTYFNTKIKDHECGFKAFKKDVILKLVNEMGFDKTPERGIAWDTEMLIRALKHGYKIKEIPIIWKEGEKSALHFSREYKSILYVVFKLKKRL